MRAVSPSPESLNSVLADRVFENLILIKRQRLGILQRRSGELAQLIAAVIDLIDGEMAGSAPAS